MRNHTPSYPPTWTVDAGDGHWWIVYDQAEGYQPAYALVREQTPTDALEAAEEVSEGRIRDDSDTIVVMQAWF